MNDVTPPPATGVVLQAQGLTKPERVIASRQGPVIQVGGREVLNFCANNYLGLAGDEVGAARGADGAGPGARARLRRARGAAGRCRRVEDPHPGAAASRGLGRQLG